MRIVPLAAAPAASSPTTFRQSDPRYSVRFRDERLVIHADGGPLAPALIRDLTRELRASMDFQLRTLGWKGVPGIERPLHVYVLTAQQMKACGMSAGGGAAFDPETYVMCRRELRGLGVTHSYRRNTEGHEALHNLQMRVEYRDWNPSYFYEGLACVMANRSAARGGAKVDWLAEEAQAASRWTPAQARLVLTQMRTSDWGPRFDSNPRCSSWDAELLGALMVEFCRRTYGAAGAAGFRQLGAISLDIRRGSTFEQAFARQLHVPLKTAEEAFVTFLRDTAGKPKARLAGTVWQGYA